MAEKRATFSLRRRFSLGFSNVRRLRTIFNVPSRSTFFLSRRNARSTGSPFFSLISVKGTHILSGGKTDPHARLLAELRSAEVSFSPANVNAQNGRSPAHQSRSWCGKPGRRTRVGRLPPARPGQTAGVRGQYKDGSCQITPGKFFAGRLFFRRMNILLPEKSSRAGHSSGPSRK